MREVSYPKRSAPRAKIERANGPNATQSAKDAAALREWIARARPLEKDATGGFQDNFNICAVNDNCFLLLKISCRISAVKVP